MNLYLSPEEAEKFDSIIKGYLRTSRSQFLKAIALQFIKQYLAGEIPEWPPQFEVRPDVKPDIKH